MTRKDWLRVAAIITINAVTVWLWIETTRMVAQELFK